MPKAVFEQLLNNETVFQGSSFTLDEHSVIVTLKRGMLLACSPDSLESLNEMTELILKTIPQGISKVKHCPTKTLETIVSLNPEGIIRYCRG